MYFRAGKGGGVGVQAVIGKLNKVGIRRGGQAVEHWGR